MAPIRSLDPVGFFFLLIETVVLRPYVFIFLAVFLFIAPRLLGWARTAAFFFFTWGTAFLCEFSSTRTGIPFGWYFYTGSTVGKELYISNVPFMDSLSFPFLLFASYCVALLFILPPRPVGPRRGPWPCLAFDLPVRTSWPVLALTVLFFVLIDVIIDPVALRGDRWFLGKIYDYPEPGIHFGVPVANYIGWAVVGLVALSAYFFLDRRLASTSSDVLRPHGPDPGDTPGHAVTAPLLLGCGLYYGVLAFNLGMTFWIGEPLIGTTGLLIFLPITVLLLLKALGHLPSSGFSAPRSDHTHPR